MLNIIVIDLRKKFGAIPVYITDFIETKNLTSMCNFAWRFRIIFLSCEMIKEKIKKIVLAKIYKTGGFY